MRDLDIALNETVAALVSDVWAPFLHNIMDGDQKASYVVATAEATRRIHVFMHEYRAEIAQVPTKRHDAPAYREALVTGQLLQASLEAAKLDYSVKKPVSLAMVNDILMLKIIVDENVAEGRANIERDTFLSRLRNSGPQDKSR